MHDVFHVSQLQKCLRVPKQAIEIEGVELEPDLSYVEYPVRILDKKDRVTLSARKCGSRAGWTCSKPE